MQIFRVLQVEDFQYYKCCSAVWEFQDCSAFKCCNIMEAFKMLLEGCSFFFEKFSCLSEIDKKKIWNAQEPTDSWCFFNELDAFHLVIMSAT